MKIRIKKLIALVLAAALMISSAPEIKIYAAPGTEESAGRENSSAAKTADETPKSEASKALEASKPLEESKASEEEMPEQMPAEDSAKTPETETQTEPESKPETQTQEESDTQPSPSENDEAKSSEIELENKSELASEIESKTESETESETPAELAGPCPDALELENTPYDENQDEFTKKLLYGKGARNAVLPESYDARTQGCLPAVRNQSPWETCWTFSILGAMETAMIKGDAGLKDSVDLSEHHLAYFGFNTGYDALGNADGDTMSHAPDDYYLTNGGNDLRGVVRLMNWNGGADEYSYPYPAELPPKLDRTIAQDASVYIRSAYRYDFATAQKINESGVSAADKEKAKAEAIKVVKKMILDYGAVSWSYYESSQYLGKDGKSYYNYYLRDPGSRTNHAIMVIGWDDNYDKAKFDKNAGRMPKNNGAWIVRNSWGAASRDAGYFYISYEDASLGSANPVYVYEVCDKSEYDNNYFYGNTAFNASIIAVRRAAQVYQVKSEAAVREQAKAVSLLTATSDVDYELQLYKNPARNSDGIVADPTSGTPMLNAPQKGTLGYAGLNTIELDKPVTFDAGDIVAVVLTFPDAQPKMYFDRSYASDNNRQEGRHIVKKGQSFVSWNLASWADNYGYNRTFRINLLTKNDEYKSYVPAITEFSITDAQDFESPHTAQIAWTKCTNAQGYKIYRSENGGAYEYIGTVESSIRQYEEGLPAKMAQYSYKIAAVYPDAENLSAASRTLDTAVKAPVINFSEYDSYRAVVRWNELAGADGYELEKRVGEAGDFVKAADFAAGSALSYADSIDEMGKKHYYRVRAKKGNDYSKWDEAFINKDLKWEQKSYYSAYYEWSAVDGAKSYKLFHKANGAAFSLTSSAEKVTVGMRSDKYLPCDEHQYYMEAYDAAGNKIYTSSVITFKMTPDAPVIDKVLDKPASDYESNVTLEWSSAPGTDKIKIFRSENAQENGIFVTEAAAADKSYADTVQKGKPYFYTLVPVAVNNKNEDVDGAPAKTEKVDILANIAIAEKYIDIEKGKEKNITITPSPEYYPLSKQEIEWSAYDDKGGQLGVSKENGADVIKNADGREICRVLNGRIIADGASDTLRFTLAAGVGTAKSECEILVYSNDLLVSGVKNAVYTGAKIEQDIRVYDGNTLLRKDIDYTVAYKNNVKVSVDEKNQDKKPQVIVKGKGSYQGSKIVRFDIIPEPSSESGKISLLKASVSRIEAQEYTGRLIIPDKLVVKYGNKVLKEDEDYTVSYKDNIFAGTAQAVIKGINGYKGIKTASFRIYCNMQKDSIKAELADKTGKVPYAKGGARPLVRVWCDGKPLILGKDYTLSYKNNNDIASAYDRKAPTAIIAGKGNYSGKIEKRFDIVKQDISTLVLAAKDKAYENKAGKFTTSFYIADKDGRKLSAGRDYDKGSAVYAYADTGLPVEKDAIVPVGTTLRISVSGTGAYEGTISGEYRVFAKDIAKVRVSRVNAQEYTGNEIKPDIAEEFVVSYRENGIWRSLKKGEEYKITYDDNINVGTAAMHITGLGDFGGTKIVKFKIRTKAFTWWWQ